MQTYPTGYAESHHIAEQIFREILPRHGMAVREEQIALCHEVLDTLYNKEISLCEAGVGTGKTLAYLVGCILWQMNRPERMKLPIVISTSSVALQDAILTEYLPDLSAVLLDEGIITAPITAVVRKGKERFVCDARLAERASLVKPSRKRQTNSLNIAAHILDMDHIPELSRYDRCRICVPKSCPRDCFMRLDCRYQQYLRDSMKPDIQICNHNYLLADASHRLEDRPLLLRSYQALVVDEAHKLPDAARQMYTENPNWEFAGIYTDEGITGTSTKRREQFNRLMDDCRAGLIDRVLVKSASRFARNTADALSSVRELKSLGVTVAFEKEGFDTETSNGEMLLSIICAVAQEESLSISQNMKWGIHKRMRTGNYITNATPFGYTQINHQLVPEKNNAMIVNDIFKSYLSGMSINEIAEHLNTIYPKENSKWNPRTIHAILRNEKYIGDSLYQKTYTTDSLPLKRYLNTGQRSKYYAMETHEGIISKTDYEKVQNLLAKKSITGEIDRTCVFSKKIYCSICGAICSRKGPPTQGFVWCCRTHLQSKALCLLKSIREDELQQAFLSIYNRLQCNQKTILEPLVDDLLGLRHLQEQKYKKRLALGEDIQHLAKQKHNLTRIHTLGYIEEPQFIERSAAIEQQIRERKQQLSRNDMSNTSEKILQKTRLIQKKLSSTPPLELFDESVFKELVKKVLISNTAIQFELINGMKLSESRAAT